VAIGARETQVQTTGGADNARGHVEEAVAQTLAPTALGGIASDASFVQFDEVLARA
jgi:hypothetical protein